MNSSDYRADPDPTWEAEALQRRGREALSLLDMYLAGLAHDLKWHARLPKGAIKQIESLIGEVAEKAAAPAKAWAATGDANSMTDEQAASEVERLQREVIAPTIALLHEFDERQRAIIASYRSLPATMKAHAERQRETISKLDAARPSSIELVVAGMLSVTLDPRRRSWRHLPMPHSAPSS